MNKLVRQSELSPHKITTGPLCGSRKVYSCPDGYPEILVPHRQIRIKDQENTNFPVYDPSGPYTEEGATIDLFKGLKRQRENWIHHRNNFESYDGRVIKTEDNGNVSNRSAATPFPLRYKPYRARSSSPFTQLEYARAGIITQEMRYVAHRENLGRELSLEKALDALGAGESFGASLPPLVTPE